MVKNGKRKLSAKHHMSLYLLPEHKAFVEQMSFRQGISMTDYIADLIKIKYNEHMNMLAVAQRELGNINL